MIEASEPIDSETRTWDNVRYYSSLGKDGLTERIHALDAEWDAEKSVVVGLAGAGMAFLALGLVGTRFWRLLAWGTLPLIFMAGQDKWRPSQGILKTLGLRTRREIHEEKYALKALRGDFRNVEVSTGSEGEILARNSERALGAVKA
jgi:hypothetical protein